MNSLLQVFFHLKSFRRAVYNACLPSFAAVDVNVNDDEETNPNEKKWSSDINIHRLEQEKVSKKNQNS